MITVTKLNDKEFVINSNLIESIEATPDTTITMSNGHKIIAKESVEEILDKIVEYNRKIHEGYGRG